MYGERRSFAPIKVGDEFDVKIEAVGEKGDGIAKVDGFVLFVPNTKEGDQVKITVTRVLRRVGFAEVIGEGKPKKGPAKEAKPAKESEPAEEDFEDTEDFGEEDKEESEESEESEDY